MDKIDGQTLKTMLISGSNNLFNHYPEIDALNVFPVPDGDTGMNMNLTLSSGIREIQNRSDYSCSDMMKSFSYGLLMGARGNSGVITSQIFNGFSKGIEGKSEITIEDFMWAWKSAVDEAYHVVKKPVEGTILTVVRESTQSLQDNFFDSMTFKRAMDILCEEGQRSLERTPDLLPILKEVGVVDSGSQGLVRIFEGMRSALDGMIVERNDESIIRSLESSVKKAGAQVADDEFGYCTEFILRLGSEEDSKKEFNGARFQMYLEAHGNSIVYVNNDDLVKVHIHTLTPGVVLNFAQQYGEFLKVKVDNMTEQHHSMTEVTQEEVTPAVQEKGVVSPTKRFAMIAVSSGEGINEYFRECGVDEIISGGQTMNPSSEDILKAINASEGENVFIFPNNSNIFMAASQAAELSDKSKKVYIIPSRNVNQGIASAFAFNPEADVQENFKEMKNALKKVKSGEITYAIRDTELEGVTVKKDDFMAISNGAIITSSPSKIEVFDKLLHHLVKPTSQIVTIFTGKDVTSKEVEEVDKILEETYKKQYPDTEFDVIDGGQPVYCFLVGVE
ncbi:MAG: DAK2 domain-containing protein [Coprobacillus sp.]|nr:DAK2 domain-containing protein [Coprobacillus sp.]